MTWRSTRLLLLVLIVSLLTTVGRAGAQPDAGPADAVSPPVSGAQVPAGDGWNFDDEDTTVETWGDLFRPQAVDLGAFAAFAAFALFSFFRKSERLKYVALGASVLYLGFYKSQLISIVNVYSFITLNLPVLKYSLAWYLFAGFTLVSTVLWGRLYCGRICAYGALTQLLDRVVPAKLRVEVPRKIEDRAAYIKYGLLAVTLAYFLVSGNISVYRYVEPFWMFTLQGSSPVLWTGVGVLLVATVFVRNLYCRFLCPVGAFLGVLSYLTVFRIKRWSECNSCKICEKTCEWGAIRGPKIVLTECVRCDDCERLYMDQQKCPHWIIIQRKSDILARQAAQRTPAV